MVARKHRPDRMIWHHGAYPRFREAAREHYAVKAMSNTHLSLRIHLVWATKNRRPWLDPEWRSRLFACTATIIARKGGKLLCAGGVRDHVHLYVESPATITVAELVGSVKSDTAR